MGSMIKPVAGHFSLSRAGRPRSVEMESIRQALSAAIDEGRVVMMLDSSDHGGLPHDKFVTRTRVAAKSLGVKVLVRSTEVPEVLEVVLLGGER